MKLAVVLLLLSSDALAQSHICVRYALRKSVPHLSQAHVKQYARLMLAAARRAKIEVGWVAARTYVESNYRNTISKRFKNCRKCIWRQSWGLMQLEVHKRCLPNYRGREKLLLLQPEVNFKIGARYLAHWKQWHEAGHCGCAAPWWLHFKYGYRIPKRKRKRPKGGWKMENFKGRFDKLVQICQKREP